MIAILARALATLWLVISLVFVTIRALPGDPTDLILGDDASVEQRTVLRRELGLDRSLGQQYVHFLIEALKGDWGTSFRFPSKKVVTLVQENAIETFKLGLFTIAWAWFLAIAIAMWASRSHRFGKTLIRVTWCVQAMPSMWVGPVLIILCGLVWRLLPIPGDDATGVRGYILPSFTLGLGLLATAIRTIFASIEQVAHEPYVVVARAKGLSNWSVQIKHVLRNAMLPLLPIAAAQLGVMLSGTIVIEKIFNRRGLGTLFLDAFFSRDFPVLQGCVGTTAVIFVVINAMIELLYRVVDPRIDGGQR